MSDAAGSARPLRVCWDSSVLVAVLNGEPSARRCGETLEAVAAGRAELLFSAVVLAEVLRSRYTTEELALIDRAFDLPNVRIVDLDAGLARFAAAIRGECYAERPKRKLKTPDAIILATAVAHGDVLYTGDRHLLNLAGRSFVGDLTIIEPPT